MKKRNAYSPEKEFSSVKDEKMEYITEMGEMF